ncbi:MAG: formylglycine-generating enzyme family protein [Phycisphaerae bacterium]|nr:formylglycine-generating enzyme family protein [Phycisphaerae bacterium]
MKRSNHVAWRSGWALGVAAVFAVVGIVGWGLAPAQGAITIEMVTVGDAGNVGELSGDGSGGYGPPRVCGAVPYVYQIGTYEVTNAHYRGFLNSVARYSDPYKLYTPPNASENWLGVISRTGAGTGVDPYVYVPRDNDPNWDTKPVNYVSWYSSLRFINWLQNGYPVAEAGVGVTETGTYTFTDPSTVSIPDHASLTTPHYALPTEDEWYKSAYYKGGGTAAGYWDYATQSDTLPNNNPPWEETGNSANYRFNDKDPNTPPDNAVGPPYYMTDVGAYTLSESPYGTYDQNGNVFEWLERYLYTTDDRQLRGGDWLSSQNVLTAYDRLDREWADAPSLCGFRVVLVPEPGAMWLLVAVWVALPRRRRFTPEVG